MEQSMSNVPGPSGRSSPSSTPRIGPSPGSVEEKYDVREKIGEGSFGDVYVGYRKSDRKRFAIKMTDSRYDSYVPGYPEELPKEVALMTILRDSPCRFLIKLQEWFLVKEEKSPYGTTIKSIVMVIEHPGLCRTLAEFLKEHPHLERRDARTLIQQIVKAAQACTRKEICHFDIHDHNILVISPPLHIKLIDFGCGLHISHDPENHPQPDTVISPVRAEKRTVNQLVTIVQDIARHCSSIPTGFMEFIAACWSPQYVVEEIQHTVDEILDQPWLRN
ncbi:serine/threonine-protein kinase pim-2-like isoform X1 [Danio rerio]|uniref:Serine/threonine-protein kinase pim-2-like isoform X1 n=1 Tax=Danio rerio TaxID=7955 RepID=A0AC58HIC7_DANRE